MAKSPAAPPQPPESSRSAVAIEGTAPSATPDAPGPGLQELQPALAPRERKRTAKLAAPSHASPAPANTLPALDAFAGPVGTWFREAFAAPTPAQALGWSSIVRGESTLLLAPTGSGKTLAAFLAAINRLMFSPVPPQQQRCRVLYISPLKALAVDVERNLRSPLNGIAATAGRLGAPHHFPAVAIRTGDTPQAERVLFQKHPPDILITTPESLYLLLTSNAREVLASVETVIVDEIHSMVATKRGAHLFLGLERLEALRTAAGHPPLQRIGLSATQKPLEEVARLLGGGTVNPGGQWTPRPVTIADAGAPKAFHLTVEVAVEDMSRLGEELDLPSGPAAAGPKRRSVWESIHPRLVEIIAEHRSTMIFVNSRRLAERLAAALNELAQAEIALAHHGSISREQRLSIEDRLKRGELPAIVATSSLELGIDMGAVDVVVQIEAPPSVASGMQRIGRASHQVGAVSRGIIFPKFRGDLLACAAATARMKSGQVEETFYPRNPLDVLAQHVVAIVSLQDISTAELYAQVRGAAPFADLPLSSFEGVLDMLSGRYPSDEFAELRPRLTWDRVAGQLQARQGARRIAVVNGGTIPDRGLYGVFLAGEDSKTSRRVGELDEEMVFESRPGEVFLLGASSWRIEEITHDRVLVSPAAGEPGKMPFWHSDRPGRPAEFGRAIGQLCRNLVAMPAPKALKALRQEHDLDERAAENLLHYLEDQERATGDVPSDQLLVFERFKDELGDWRVCILSPFGARVHAPWAMSVTAALKADSDADIEGVWSDDGMVFRLPESDAPPELEQFLPDPEHVEEHLIQALSGTSLFAARFRENAARALLLPRRHPGRRSPLWAQRKRSADLLAVAARFGSFPIILETYRECLRDVFDLPALLDLLRQVRDRQLGVKVVDSRAPSPFAASLLFSYVANFIYDGDAPLAERRAQALAVDHAQLKELLGEAELRELLDGEAITSYEAQLQRLESSYPLRHADNLHDLLLALGELTEVEIVARSRAHSPATAETELEEAGHPHLAGAGAGSAKTQVTAWLEQLQAQRRVIAVSIAGELRYAAAEDAGKLRDALGIVIPPGLPEAFLTGVPQALQEVASRYARTHGPFTAAAAAARYGLGIAPVTMALEQLAARGRLLSGEFLPGGHGGEWCDPEVLRAIKRRSLARLRKQVEPVEPAALGRFLAGWQGLERKARGLDGLLNVLEQLQGTPLPASVLETDILPARLDKYKPGDLDTLCAAGEVIWRGINPLGPQDGRIALYLTDSYPLLAPGTGAGTGAATSTEPWPDTTAGALAPRVRELLQARGALFFSDLTRETGAFSQDLLEALWLLVWNGEITNDTLTPLRSLLGAVHKKAPSTRRTAPGGGQFRSRRQGPPGSEGRWSLLPTVSGGPGAPSPTQKRTALASQLLERYGVVTREAVQSEGGAGGFVGGFSAVYEVLKAMEEGGKIRRGYFVAGLGATQFALPGADDRLRGLRNPAEEPQTLVLAATDPANPYGAALPWPERPQGPGPAARPGRTAGAQVILHDGQLLAWIGRTERSVLTFLPEEEPGRGQCAAAVARGLASLLEDGHHRAVLISKIDGGPPDQSPLGPALRQAGFAPGSRGYLARVSR